VEAIAEIALTSKAYLKKALLLTAIKTYINISPLLVQSYKRKWHLAKQKILNGQLSVT